MLISLTKKYFNAFSKKDIGELKELFDKSIYLQDWEVQISSLNKVIDFVTDLFDKNDFRIEIQNMFCDKNTVIAEIHLFYDSNKYIKVVDIISFNEQLKIKSIRAYKG